MKSFVKINERKTVIKNGNMKHEVVQVYPTYLLDGEDIMKRGGDFYAALTSKDLWSTSEDELFRYIDEKTIKYCEKYQKDGYGIRRTQEGFEVHPLLLVNSDSGEYRKFVCWFRDLPKNFNYKELDTELTFKSDKVKPEDYRSKRLKYDPVAGPAPNYEKLMSTLYTPENRAKIEWAIGSILCGDAKTIEKLLVLYGLPGSGKSTVLKIIMRIFDGYYASFSAQSLVSAKDQFAISAFKDNPLVAIQDDGKLDKIESPTINEIVSHSEIIINEKNVKRYTITSRAFLILATNSPVDFKDTKQGMIRRTLDVYPSGNKIPVNEYRRVVASIKYEIPHIAQHCIDVYKSLGKEYYVDYRPLEMVKKTNYIQNFLFDNLDELVDQNEFKRNDLYVRYKAYCEESGLGFPPRRIDFGESLKEYFDEYYEIKTIKGKTYRHIYKGIKLNKILPSDYLQYETIDQPKTWIQLDQNDSRSLLDEMFESMPAQYANSEGNPVSKWQNCKGKLKAIDPHKLHWVKLPEEIIKIDFDLKDENGEKSLERNIEAASSYPPTYCEVSKSGGGLHLYYVWKGGDVSELASHITEDIEIKKSTGGLSHRRLLTKCNDLPIATISSGLPLAQRKEDKMIDQNVLENDATLTKTINKCLRKAVHPHTTPNVEFIYDLLEKAYKSGSEYDVTPLRDKVYQFCLNSTNQKEKCLALYSRMHFKSDHPDERPGDKKSYGQNNFIFYDIEIYPNVFHISWKIIDKEPVYHLTNPSPEEVEVLFNMLHERGYLFGGFNNRKYDDHLIYGRITGNSIERSFNLSQAIITNQAGACYREAYHFADFDVFDFATKKQSLKRWEYDLEKEHMEMEFAWDQPLDEKYWDQMIEYCDNDVRATEAVFKACYTDYVTRVILSELSGLSPIDTNRQHITAYLLGDSKKVDHVYTDLATGEMTIGTAIESHGSKVITNERPYKSPNNFKKDFPGYKFNPKGIPLEEYTETPDTRTPLSIYHGVDPSEGGYVYAKPGLWYDVVCYDVAGMHPASIIALSKLGDLTYKFERLRDTRIAIKHRDFKTAIELLGDEFAKYLQNENDADNLSLALKLILNSTYGIMAAKFDNPLRDPRDIDNIVAKRGALFMIGLKDELLSRGYNVVHIKTDSIKVVKPDAEIEQFIMDYGKKYGYNFEVEHRFKKFCLVNKAVYIAKAADNDPSWLKKCKKAKEKAEETKSKYVEPTKWEATGAQFAHPYVFKTLFSKEPLEFKDYCELKSVSTAMYLDMNEHINEGEHAYKFVGKVGSFVPVLPGFGGGILLRKSGDTYSSVTGTKKDSKSFYRWCESVNMRGHENLIDMSYFENLKQDAIDNINSVSDGHFEDLIA